MTSFLWATDQHLKDVSPSSRKDDWKETCLDKIRQVKEHALDLKVDAVLYGGDFFDVKVPSKTSHNLVSDVIDAHKDFPCPIYSNVGNHDVKLSQLKYLDQSPLGTLFSSGVFLRCYDQHELDLGSVRVVGIPYHGTKYDRKRFSSIRRKSDEKIICLCHLLASPSGGSMFKGEDIIKYSELLEFDPDVFCFGHWHKDQGIQEISENKWVVNIGSTSRGSLSEDDIQRIPSIAHISLRDGKFEITKIPLRVKPASEVFDFEKREQEETRTSMISAFVEKIEKIKMGPRSNTFEEEIESISLSSRVKERILQLWEASRV